MFQGKNGGLTMLWGTLIVVASCVGQVSAQDTSPAFEQPNIKPTLRDFLSGRPIAERLRIRKTDELLRPPFAEKPVDSVKGLAASIRAEELDVCNRVKAAEYLGTVDCKAYPEAQEMLIDTMHNDKYELVRLAAAKALGNMLKRVPQQCRILAVNPDADLEGCPMKKRGYQAPWEKSDKRFLSGYDQCPGCCNEDVLNALAKTAYEVNDDGCCFEPSPRVRQMAAWALSQCGICCREQAWPFVEPTPTDPPEEPPVKKQQGEVDPTKSGEVDPTKSGEQDADTEAGEGTDAAFLVPPSLTELDKKAREKADFLVPPPVDGVEVVSAEVPAVEENVANLPALAALRDYCIVGLHRNEFKKVDEAFYSVFEGRLYYFASKAAKETFDTAPQKYAVALSGMDPVEYTRTGDHVEGKYLRRCNGRFFLFSTKENWTAFTAKRPSGNVQVAAEEAK